ncbi:hypothetical protein GA0004736_2887 [Curtobacterium sp. 9128]|uniref:hypothetical protein n=1 Tax=Curtobacterium sp. 9128 TaxID=1793722 RepID=UPI0007D726C3|nr:hypothetical protein [Curtobacterium sp. 9128]SBN63938.1 hypothetical protein GA0004736_2887 [Curtobacterium sp. 9128]
MERTRRTLLTALAAVVVGIGATALAWYRLGPVTRGTAWAEDGGLFLRERLALGVDGSLLHPYAGYLHLLPRLVVDLGVARPIEQYALTVSAASCAIAGAVCATVFLLSRDVVRAWPLRLVLAAVPVVLPLAPYEISGTAANLHWYMLVAVPWLFSYRARTWWGASVVAVLALVAVLTEVQTVLFLPLLLLAWFPRSAPRLRALPVTVVALGAGAAQAVVALTTHRSSVRGDPSVVDVVAGYLVQPVAATWDRDVAAVGRAVAAHGWWVVAVPVVVLVLLVLAAMVVGTWPARFLLVGLAGGSVAVWVAALVANSSADGRWGSLDDAHLATLGATRYAAAAGMLLLSAVVLTAAVLVEQQRTGGTGRVIGAAVAWCVVALVVAVSVLNVAPGPAQRSAGPVWAPQVTESIAACRAEPGRILVIRTAPWAAEVPCSLVLRDR